MKLDSLLREALKARPVVKATAKAIQRPSLATLGAAIHEYAKLHYANNRYAKVIR